MSLFKFNQSQMGVPKDCCRIKVEGIPQNVSLRRVYELFNSFGCVADLIFCGNFYKVQYRTKQQAYNAIKALNGSTMFGFMSKLHACFLIYKKASCLLIYSILRNDLSDYKQYFEKIHGFKSFETLETEKGFAPLAVAYFNYGNINSIMRDFIRSSVIKSDTYVEVKKHIEPTKEELLKVLKAYESRTIHITGLWSRQRITEQQIYDSMSLYNITKILRTGREYEVPFATVLMESNQDALECIREMNENYLKEVSLHVHVAPYLIRGVPHEYTGVLVVNELSPDLCNYASLYSYFTKYGRVLCISLCPCLESLICFVLYERYEDASYAKTVLDLPNIFLFPKLKAEKAISIFTPKETKPNLTLLMYYNKSMNNISIRRQCSECTAKRIIKDFFCFASSSSKITVCTYNRKEDLNSAIDNCKKKGTAFEIIGKSTFEGLFNLFPILKIDKALADKIFYASGVGKSNNAKLRAAFSTIAPVESVINIEHRNKALVLFKDCINQRDPRLINILPDIVRLESVQNKTDELITQRSYSQGQLNALFSPASVIVDEMKRRDSTKVKKAVGMLKSLTSDDLVSISTDQEKINKFCEDVLSS